MPRQPYVNPITGQPFTPRLNVPEVFGKGLSYEDQINMLLAFVEQWHQIIKDYPELQAKYDELLQEFEDFKEHGFAEYYEQQIAQWVADNMNTIMSDFAQIMLIPGLTQDGRFCVYIPKTWNQVQFSTGTSGDEFGRLILSY